MIVKLIIGIVLAFAAAVVWLVWCLCRVAGEMGATEREVEEEWDLLDGDCDVVD